MIALTGLQARGLVLMAHRLAALSVLAIIILSAWVSTAYDKQFTPDANGEYKPSVVPGKVYLVVGSDTAIWNDGFTVDVRSRHPHYAQDFFTDPASPSFQVMDPVWRNQFKDSFGQPIKFTWWLMGGNIYRDADNLNIPTANTMVLHLMKKYHGEAIRQFGDELSLHYHTFYWSDYAMDGTYFWNQSRTFDECREDFDVTLAQYLLDEDVFPVSFRSGWHFMDDSWQQYLDQLLPFSMHDNWPAYKTWYTNEPINNVQDWSRSSSSFVPYHPATNDYQVPGSGRGWDLRSIKMQSLTQSEINSVFSKASNGVDQVVCIWNHLPESFVPYFARTDSLVQFAAAKHKGVAFRYCTAVEAMQRWLGTTNTTPSQIDVLESTNGGTISLTIRTSKPLFQPRPFVAVRDACQRYANISSLAVPAGVNTWTVAVPIPRDQLSKIGIAATDLDGNLATRIIRHLPDNVYIDNLDPQYAQLQGNWTTITNAAWGTNSCTALLGSADMARVEWSLPITRSGQYNLSIQVPRLTNAAGRVAFNAYSGGTHVHSVFFELPMPQNQWVSLGNPILDGSVSNTLEMIVSGANQPGTYAVADVLRVVPIPDTGPPSPVITHQPQSCTNQLGSTTVFEVDALSYDTMSYQWFFGSNALAGATNSMLTLTNLQLALAGNYSVVLANIHGSTTSAVALLTVNRPPVAFPRGMATLLNQPITISIPEFLANDYDPDGDSLIMGASHISANFGSISLGSTQLTYYPSQGFSGLDYFTYQVSDGRGGLCSAQVSVLVLASGLPAHECLLPVSSPSGFLLRFAGTPGQVCEIQRSSDLSHWQTIDTQVMPLVGVLDFKDPAPASVTAFYRVRLP